MLSEHEIKEIQAEAAHYEHKRAAGIEALKIVQKKHGWVSDDALKEVAKILGMTPDELDNVATFYSLIYRKPVGKHVVSVCDSVSCWIVGYENLRKALETKLGVKLGQTTEDGKFTLLPNACLGCCDKGPALMVGEDLHTNVTPENVDKILGKYK